MLEPMSEREKELTVKACVRGAKDITKLNGRAYQFLYLSSGFIAHYNRPGFIDYYREPGSLRQDILDFASENTWTNFRPGEQNYDYYHQKGEIYRAIVECLA
jgi:hypothetical protein